MLPFFHLIYPCDFGEVSINIYKENCMEFQEVERPESLSDLFNLFPDAVQTASNGDKFIEFTEPSQNGEDEFWGRVWEDGEVTGNNAYNQCTPFSIVM